jgi:hypothetical protein
LSLADAFANNFQNGCGSAQPNFAFATALITQPNALISHGKYMYTGPIGGTVYQFLVKVNPISGLSEYKFRTYVTGLSIVTGLGTDDALQSLFIFADPTAIGLAGREFVTKVPLCEDMDGEVVIGAGDPPPGGQGNGAPQNPLGTSDPALFTANGAGATSPSSGGTGAIPFGGGGAGAASIAPTGADFTTTNSIIATGANTTTPRATTINPSAGATTPGPTTPGISFTMPSVGIGTGAANTPTGIGIIAIGGSTNGFPPDGVIKGQNFTVKFVPNRGG